jgi:ABC-2 type transport system ATP-binding protein
VTESNYALQIQNVSKTYHTVKAVDDLSFDVGYGEIFGLLGPNGAGKTTTIRMILDLIKPDGGSISVLGRTMDEDLKSRIGYLPEERGLYEDMTLWDTLLFLGQLKGLSRRKAEEQVEWFLKKVELWDARKRKVEALSRGMNQKAQFVAATLHEPDLIIVDEPFTGLDPVNTRIIKDLLYSMQSRGAAIIMSTHQMHRVEEMCGRILLINEGRRVLYGPLADIRRQFAENALEVEVEGELVEVAGAQRIARQDGVYRILPEEGVEPEQILENLVRTPGIRVQRFERVETSLDEIFVRQVSHKESPE